jgi:CO dehydrogenase/acetyl-CoA synthase delta subunit
MNFLKKINRLINPKGFEKINHKELNKLLKNNKIEAVELVDGNGLDIKLEDGSMIRVMGTDMDFLLSNHTKK